MLDCHEKEINFRGAGGGGAAAAAKQSFVKHDGAVGRGTFEIRGTVCAGQAANPSKAGGGGATGRSCIKHNRTGGRAAFEVQACSKGTVCAEHASNPAKAAEEAAFASVWVQIKEGKLEDVLLLKAMSLVLACSCDSSCSCC